MDSRGKEHILIIGGRSDCQLTLSTSTNLQGSFTILNHNSSLCLGICGLSIRVVAPEGIELCKCLLTEASGAFPGVPKSGNLQPLSHITRPSILRSVLDDTSFIFTTPVYSICIIVSHLPKDHGIRPECACTTPQIRAVEGPVCPKSRY